MIINFLLYLDFISTKYNPVIGLNIICNTCWYFSYSGPFRMLGSDRKQITALGSVRGVGVAVRFSYDIHDQAL